MVVTPLTTADGQPPKNKPIIEEKGDVIEMEWIDGKKIQITPPKRPKKLTATRFATVLGLNPWSTPFEVWCEVTRTWQRPFEDTI